MAQAKVSPTDNDTSGATVGTCDVPLLKDEKGGLMMEYGISTITFYEGDFQAASNALRDQFETVAKVNPWICGQLVKTKPNGITLRHPSVVTSKDTDTVLTVLSEEVSSSEKLKLDRSIPYAELAAKLYASDKLVIGTGYSLVGKSKPVTLLSLVESAPGKYSMIFSMSHAIADGRTYYEILQMLQPGTVARALSVTRVMSFSDDCKNAFGRKEMEWADSVSANIRFTFTYMFAKQAKCYAFHLDDDKLAKAKAASAEGVEFVSTNDILTSAFFQTCEASFGWMGFDCRDKGLKDVGADLAGNYVTALVLGPDVFETPASLRKVYTPGKPYETIKRPLPKCCCGPKLNLAMATNWSSFTGNLVRFDGSEMLLHLPVQNPKYVCFDLMIPFVSKVTSDGTIKKGVMCWTLKASEDELRQAMPVGESISDTIFP